MNSIVFTHLPENTWEFHRIRMLPPLSPYSIEIWTGNKIECKWKRWWFCNTRTRTHTSHADTGTMQTVHTTHTYVYWNWNIPFTTEMFSFSESADFLDFLLFFLVPDLSDFSVALFSVLVMISSAPLLSARSTLDYTINGKNRRQTDSYYILLLTICWRNETKPEQRQCVINRK